MATVTKSRNPSLESPSISAELPEKVASSTSPLVSAEQDYTIVQSTQKLGRKTAVVEDDEPLVDTTAAMAKNSKKTRRLQKQQQKRLQRAVARDRPESFLDLPAELLQEILGCLRPSDVFRLQLLNSATRDFIQQNERAIAKDIVDRRYWVLQRCFPLPIRLEEVDEHTRLALLNPRREKMTEIHKKPYQHIKPLDPREVCSCPSCLVAWNNLNVALDFAYFQGHLNHREPLPMIPRGSSPKWNSELTEAHARIVERAISSPLTTVGTLLRQVRFPPQTRVHQHNKMISTKTFHPSTLYQVTERDANGSDEFLERDGALVRPSYDVPFNRDNYYSLLAYVPNRKWSKDERRWLYYARGAHERDLEWTRRWFLPKAGDDGSQPVPVPGSQPAMKT
ncbi:hypothetical protein LTR35_000018 [Friedmanniomyces endolithicus]|uniref:F-box domain-containing protein n=1 Tax=Friedmanniomyces endolithicus TaxID=329885 RepID=A0AAN6FKM7_9PEZI|nr:hypothetical protein LTS00_008663 [Friedmanniomyces endolithicus]KAK0293414.1 hypothetical protein LTR35_000018 [Friedmanniomyces endolithicus]KAK0319012.1 hypothetical protein LTR82_010112 [Friedmanniomyces endolithicus]